MEVRVVVEADEQSAAARRIERCVEPGRDTPAGRIWAGYRSSEPECTKMPG